jgi:hypothetical protein
VSFPIEAYRDHLAAGKTHEQAVRLAREEFERQRATGRKSVQRDSGKVPPHLVK